MGVLLGRVAELEEKLKASQSNGEMEALREELAEKSQAAQKGALALHQVEELRAKNRTLETEMDGITIKLRRLDELTRYNKDLEKQLSEAAAKISDVEQLRQTVAAHEVRLTVGSAN
jgi:cell shape-determining protein MreC